MQSNDGLITMTDTRDFLRVAICNSDHRFADQFSDFLSENASHLQVVLISQTWPQLVEDENFPARVVFLDVDAEESVSLRARIRACRATGAVVVAVTAVAEGAADWQQTQGVVEAAGAKGLVSTHSPFSNVVELIGQVADPVSSRSVDDDWRPLPGTMQSAGRDRAVVTAPRLSRGELEAVALYASGKTVAEVGTAMNVQYETAKTFLRRVREKYALLGRPASNREDLTSRATEDGFLT